MYEQELVALSKAGARYLVIGRIALGLHGHLQSTVDLDLLPDLNSENLGIMINTLQSLEYAPRVPVNPEELKDPKKREYWRDAKNMKVFSFINLKNQIDSIDLMIYHPFDFEESYARRQIVPVDDAEVTVASVQDLLTLKRKAMRPKDLADIEILENMLEMENERLLVR